MAGKQFSAKSGKCLSGCPEGIKIRRNHSLLRHFQDKYIFVSYAEIQNGRQKWCQNNFWKKIAI